MTGISHFGVKGMHWGIRKEADRRINAFADQFWNTQSYGTREITEAEYNALPSKPIKLGQDFNRTVFGGVDHLRGDIVYVTKIESDSNRYMAMNGHDSQEHTKREQLKITTGTEAISPGLKERIDTYVKLLDKPLYNPDSGRVEKSSSIFTSADPNLSALSSRELGLKTYQIFAQSQHANTPLHSAYFEEIRKKGYTALVDDADRGIMADLPIILFPKESGARVTEVKRVTHDDVVIARANLTNPDLTKRGTLGV